MATSSASLPLNIYPSRSRLFYVGRHFQALQAVLDVLAILLAWQISISLRILLNPVMTIHLTRNLLKSMTPPIGGILILWVVAAWWLGVYKKSSVLSVGTTLIRIMESVAVLG